MGGAHWNYCVCPICQKMGGEHWNWCTCGQTASLLFSNSASLQQESNMLRGSAIVVIGLLSICGLCWAQSSTSPSVASPTPLDADRARVFLTDSESWEMSG